MKQGSSTQYQLLVEMDGLREMNRTITALLDNLPGMTFSKDAKTGVYLACNQAFAEYAHKERPDGVIGLTDGDIFDPVTAAHFAEDDQKALAMEKPYIFFEDVPDAVGRQRQFQTTKTKYVDSSGRLCLFGMFQDVTDVVRVQRENAATRAAYEEARSNGIIYAPLAHALARGYTDLYYVNMDSDAFIEFHTDDQSGVLSEARRGNDFFEGCERDAKLYVHREDQAAFVAAMDRNFLSNVLDQVKVFELVYRRIKGGDPFYVQMKVSRMEDDKRFIVIAVSDIREASQIIREVFRNSPVFRIGGDEFAVVCQGKEYSFSETLLEKMGRRNREAVDAGGIVIACGLAKFKSDLCVATVFDRADHRMYENKNTLKQQSELVQNPRPC